MTTVQERSTPPRPRRSPAIRQLRHCVRCVPIRSAIPQAPTASAAAHREALASPLLGLPARQPRTTPAAPRLRAPQHPVPAAQLHPGTAHPDRPPPRSRRTAAPALHRSLRSPVRGAARCPRPLPWPRRAASRNRQPVRVLARGHRQGRARERPAPRRGSPGALTTTSDAASRTRHLAYPVHYMKCSLGAAGRTVCARQVRRRNPGSTSAVGSECARTPPRAAPTTTTTNSPRGRISTASGSPPCANPGSAPTHGSRSEISGPSMRSRADGCRPRPLAGLPGALLAGERHGGGLRYMGSVGTGWSDATSAAHHPDRTRTCRQTG